MKLPKLYCLTSLFFTLSIGTSTAWADYVTETGKCFVQTTPTIAAALFNHKKEDCNGNISFIWEITHHDAGNYTITTTLDANSHDRPAVIEHYDDHSGRLVFTGGETNTGGVYYKMDITTDFSHIRPLLLFRQFPKGASTPHIVQTTDAICKVNRFPAAISMQQTYYSPDERTWEAISKKEQTTQKNICVLL